MVNSKYEDLFLVTETYLSHLFSLEYAATALNGMFTSMNSPSQLTGWTATGGDPCGQSWKGVTCSGSRVTQL